MANQLKNLRKSYTDKKLAGICGGFGEYTPMPSWLWRAIFVASVFLGGMGIITYIILWALMPDADIHSTRERAVEGETVRHL